MPVCVLQPTPDAPQQQIATVSGASWQVGGGIQVFILGGASLDLKLPHRNALLRIARCIRIPCSVGAIPSARSDNSASAR